jgi:SNF family Na+-dependent transporter
MLTLFADGTTIPKEFFTKQSTASLTAVVAMVTVVANGIQRLTNRNPVWLAWLIAEAICFVGMFSTNADPRLLDYLLTVVNGFLVFSAAAGVTSAGDAILRKKPPAAKSDEVLTSGRPPVPRKFFTSWFRNF